MNFREYEDSHTSLGLFCSDCKGKCFQMPGSSQKIRLPQRGYRQLMGSTLNEFQEQMCVQGHKDSGQSFNVRLSLRL